MTPGEDTGAAVRGIQPRSQPEDENKDRSTFPQRQLDLALKSKGPTRSTFSKARELLKQPVTEVVICPTPSEKHVDAASYKGQPAYIDYTIF